MTIQPPTPQAIPIEWQCDYQDVSIMDRICVLKYRQASMMAVLTLDPDVMIKFGEDIADCGRRAKTDLKRTSSMPDPMNGDGKKA